MKFKILEQMSNNSSLEQWEKFRITYNIAIGKKVKKRQRFKNSMKFVKATWKIEEHHEDYEDVCFCRLCQSYA